MRTAEGVLKVGARLLGRVPQSCESGERQVDLSVFA